MTANRIDQNLTGKMIQQLQLSTGQLQSLEILALPQAALESFLTQEFAVNPVLEESPPPADIPDNSHEERPETPDDENDYEKNAGCADEWADELPLPGISGGVPADELDYLGNSPAPPPSLKTMLINELECSNCPEELHAAALEIISALDEDGFIAVPLADIAMANDLDMETVMQALHYIQMIAPAGVAARDVAESLKLQLSRAGKLTPAFEKLLTEGREDLEKNRLPALCDKLQLAPDELAGMLRTLRSLNPAPGRDSYSSAAVVVPDLEILPDGNGGYRVAVRRERQARVMISPLYEKLLQDGNLSADDRGYLQEKISRAKELVQALNMRDSTLKRLGEMLVDTQREFFEHGIKELRPLTMKQAAGILELSESTISRAVSEKTAETPQGSYPLRFFFPGGFNSDAGEAVAVQAVKEKIRNAIGKEDPHAPLSDETLSAMLKAEGLNVARRTVAKYRESMKIPASSLRKKHF